MITFEKLQLFKDMMQSWLFARLQLFYRTLKNDSKRFK